MRKVAVLSVGRSDYGIYRPVIKRMATCSSIHPVVIAAGAHLSPDFGMTVNEIEKDGFEIAARVEIPLSNDTPEAISTAIGHGAIGFSRAYDEVKPDLLMVLGDRFEMMAGTLAALPFKIPVAHLHGGELSFGAIDDSMRHAMTKLSHLHFASTKPYAKRIIQLGEEPWRVHVSGAPGLDAFQSFVPLSPSEFQTQFGAALPDRFLLVTYHPVTLGNSSPAEAMQHLVQALELAGLPVVFTMPNPDSGGRAIRQVLAEELPKHPSWLAFESLGTRGFYTAMSRACAVVGNSSSGIIEAASLGLPVVNVGPRQEGRTRGENVIDAEETASGVLGAIGRALEPPFRAKLIGMENPYGDGRAAERIVDVLEQTPFDERLIQKRFHDLGGDR